MVLLDFFNVSDSQFQCITVIFLFSLIVVVLSAGC